VLAADVVSKVAVVAALRPGEQVDVVGSVLRLTLTRNSGAAFSVGTGATWLFTAVAFVVVAVILRQARRLRRTSWAVTLGLLLGGALGNLADRLFRAPGPLRGHVVDWIQLPHWPVFNLADSAIVIGGALAVVLTSRGTPLDGVPGDGSGADADAGGAEAGAAADRDRGERA
jgi:signal peptidase II